MTDVNGHSTGTWGTDDGDEYSVEKFYTRSESRSRQTRVYLPEDYLAQIAQLVQGKDIAEYKTVQDFVRDAIHHRLHWALKERVQTPESAHRLRVMQIRSDAEMAAADIDEHQQMLNAVDATLGNLVKIGDRRAVQKQIAKLELEAENFGDPWRWQLLDRLENYRDNAGAGGAGGGD